MNRRKKHFVFIVVLLVLFLGVSLIPSETPDAIYQTIFQLDNKYYDPGSVSYSKLLNIALESVQEILLTKDIVVNFTPISSEQSNQEARKAFKAQWINKVAEHETSDHELEFAAIESIMKSFNDSHTYFLSPQSWASYVDRLKKQEYEGIGILVKELEGQKIFIKQIFPGTPAELTGLLPFDQILKVDGYTISGIEDAVDKIRGMPGTTVIITVLRNQQLYDIPVVRDVIQRPVLTTKIFNSNSGKRILYIQLYAFYDDFSRLLISDIEKYIPVQGIIIDVRDNSGGLLSSCYDLLDVFLPKGVDLFIEKSTKETKITASTREQVYAKPLLVMINQYSASASEVLSGVLQQQKRAIIVGRQSEGAVSIGTISKLWKYPAGISITVRQFFTAGGKKLEGIGVIPDIKVDFNKDDFIAGHDPQLEKAIEILSKLID